MCLSLVSWWHGFIASHSAYTAGRVVEVLISGSFGGLVYAVTMLLDLGRTQGNGEATWQATKGVPLRFFLAAQALIGAAGAFAAVFGMLTLGNAVHAGEGNDITSQSFYLIALCVVGGFVGNRLLSRVGQDLADKLTAVDSKADAAASSANKAIETADHTKELLDQSNKMLLDIAKAMGIVDELEEPLKKGEAIREPLRTQAVALRETLLGYAKSFPTERALIVVLANLNFNLGRTEEAFGVLNKFLEDKKKSGLPEGDDEATVWFNIACYHSFLTGKTDKSEERMQLQQKAIDALGKSLQIVKASDGQRVPYWISKSKADPDLQAIVTTPKFQELVEGYRPK